jgi:hypothetical protein
MTLEAKMRYTMSNENEYGYGWMNFREFSRENIILLRIIKEILSEKCIQLERGYTLLDVGSGDAKLVYDLISSPQNILPVLPHRIDLVEPCPYLSEKANKNIRNITNIFHPDFDKFIVEQTTGKMSSYSTFFQHPGLMLMIHSSYYLSDSDVDVINNLRKMGYVIIVIENSLDCWVPEVMRLINNTSHPQFNVDRFSNLLSKLNISDNDVIKKEIAINLSVPSILDVNAMIPFFHYQTGENHPHGLRRSLLENAFKKVLNNTINSIPNYPKFSYNCILLTAQA